MEAIGTITMYFPFLDDESREIMQNTMDEAYSYYDFVQRLNQRVLDLENPDLVVYFAIHHSAMLLDMDSIEAIGRKYNKLLILHPNLFYARVFQGHAEDIERVHEAADALLASNPPDWLEAEARFLKFEVDLLHYPKVIYDTENLEILTKMIENSPKFELYESIMYDCLREKASRVGDTEEVARCTELAIESAEKVNDIVRLAYHLRTKFAYLQYTDRVEAKNVLLEARDLHESLGIRAGIASSLYHLSRLDAVRGEYNLAIERNLEVVSIRESLGLPKAVYSVMLSTLHNVIGDFESGLEWARMAEKDFKHRPAVFPRAVMNQAWSLIQLGKKTEALMLINSIREDVLKSGQDILLGWFSFISGLLEVAEGELEIATKSFEDALDIYSEKGSLDNSLIFMHHLAKLDVTRACSSSAMDGSIVSLSWLDLLEEKAVTEDLPGVLGQVHILKAELAIARNDEAALRISQEKVRSLGKEPSMAFLIDALERLPIQV
jgi:tetratricopeptide (TPR) repeat protein